MMTVHVTVYTEQDGDELQRQELWRLKNSPVAGKLRDAL